MYINKPLIKVQRVRVPSRQSYGSPSGGQYLLDIIRQLEEIQNNWAKLLKSSDEQIERAKRQRIQVENDQAFLHCQAMLDEEYQSEEDKFSKIRRQLKVAMQTVEEHIQICENQKKERAQQIQNLKVEVDDLEGEEANFGKKAKRKHELKQKIDDYSREIEAASVRLQAAKQKSYEQKGLYHQTHEIEVNLLDQISQTQQGEKHYFDYKARQQKYKQLSRIVEKLHSKTNAGSKDVQQYLKDKINSMAHLRTNILSINDKIAEYDTSMEEQLYVIDGLKRKAHEEREEDDQMFKKYQNKYERMYFSRNNDLDNWKNYKAYLQEKLKQNQLEPMKNPRATYSANNIQSYTEGSPLSKTSHSRRISRLRTEPGLKPIDEEDENSRYQGAYKYSNTPGQFNRSLHRENSVHLPRLVRMSGHEGEAGKIKQNLKQMINESDVSLESVNSDQALSGEFIEVQFHKK